MLESYGSSSQEGLPYGRIFPHHTEESETDQNGLWRHFIWLALLFLRRISTASETDETLTRLTQSTHVPRVHVSYAISFMSYHVSDLEKFPVSQKVMLFFFYFIFFLLLLLSRVRPFVFWLFWRIKFCFKPRRTLNGSQETLLGSFLWLAVCSNK